MASNSFRNKRITSLNARVVERNIHGQIMTASDTAMMLKKTQNT